MIEEAKAKELLHAIPYWRWMGFQVGSITEEEAVIRCPHRREFHNSATVQGGVLAGLMDGCVAALLARHRGDTTSFTTVECNVNYLRPVGERDMVGKARLVKMGRTLVFADTRVESVDGELLATGTFTYFLLEGKTLQMR